MFTAFNYFNDFNVQRGQVVRFIYMHIRYIKEHPQACMTAEQHNDHRNTLAALYSFPAHGRFTVKRA